MNVGSLFSGIGGLDLGLERAGMRIVWQVECDPYARAVLRKHWPDVPCYEDVREVGAANLAPVDLICGGFPCQDISYAGNGAGLAGEKSSLWFHYARIVGEIRARYVVAENVAAWRRWVPVVRRHLHAAGYSSLPLQLPAGGFGAPHIRKRVLVVAHAAGVKHKVRASALWRKAAAIIPPDADDLRELQPQRLEPDERRWAGDGNRWWAAEPGVERVVYGVPRQVDRIRCLGNAVVPQVAEYIGRLILAHAEGSQMTSDCPTASEQAPLPYRESRQAKGEVDEQ